MSEEAADYVERVGLILDRRRGDLIYLFFEDTESIIEVTSINEFPKSVDIKVSSSEMDWRLSTAPREPLVRLSMTEQDAVHVFSGNVSMRMACLQIDRGRVKLAFKTHPDVRLLREEMAGAVEEERRKRGIV